MPIHSTRKSSVLVSPILILLILWGFLLIKLDARWWGLGDENGAWISAVVRSYQIYGAAELKFLQVKNLGPATPASYDIYNHHPPLVSWTAALGAAAFGFHEASLRFVTACATWLGAAAFYVLCRRLVGQRQALWALGFYAFTPMTLYYGRMPDHEALALLFILTFLAVFINWLKRPTSARGWALAVLVCLAAWTAWGALFFIGAILLWGFWFRPSLRKPIVGLGIVTFSAVVILLVYYQLAWPGTLDDLMAVFFHRVSNQAGTRGTNDFTVLEFINKQAIHLVTLMTPSLLILVGIGTVYLGRLAPFRNQGGDHRSLAMTRRMAVTLLAAGVMYLLVFRNASYIHDYYKIYLCPAFAYIASFTATRWTVKHARYSRPALGGLLVAWVITGGYFLQLLHQSADRPYLDILTRNIQSETQAEDIILTNSDYAIPAVAFYSFHEIRRNVPPETALIIAEAAEQRVYYVYCAIDVVLPDELEGYAYTGEEPCLYVWLKR